eukprot:12640577-Alexandrium_andersonii.AAC.1
MPKLYAFFKTMGKQHGLWRATVGPHDLLYMPAAFVFAERVRQADVLGFRYQCMGECSVEPLEAMCRFLGV